MKKGKIIPIGSGRKDKHIISKEKFVEILEKLKTVHDTEEQVNTVISENIEKMGCLFYDSSKFWFSHEATVVELLAFMMRDEYEDIKKFVYEMDFGRRETKTFSITLEGKIIYLDTAEKLYDYLEKHFEE